jgi:hypothetical protein
MSKEPSESKEPSTVQPPSPGRIVRYVLDSGPNAGQGRPALIVVVRDDGRAGLYVFTDCGHPDGDLLPLPVWRDASYDPDGARGTWSWPPYVAPKAPVETPAAAGGKKDEPGRR